MHKTNLTAVWFTPFIGICCLAPASADSGNPVEVSDGGNLSRGSASAQKQTPVGSFEFDLNLSAELDGSVTWNNSVEVSNTDSHLRRTVVRQTDPVPAEIQDTILAVDPADGVESQAIARRNAQQIALRSETSVGDSSPGAAATDTAAVGQKGTPTLPLKFGVDLYAGASSLKSQGRFRDGFWAGSGPAFPSVAYLNWDNGKGSAAKLSIGAGKMYTASDSALDQPVEAWYQMPAGNLSLTVGKFWVPFAAQEWQYETKPGVMVQWAKGASSLSASANYNRQTQGTNAYLRFGRSFGEDASVGVSLGAGKGLSYDSIHNRAVGLDGTYAWNGLRFNGEYVLLQRKSSERFHFGYAKLSYENLGKWTPFVARYTWKDKSDAFGEFDSTTFGLNYQLTSYLSVESAYAATSDKGVQWVQLHWAWER